MKRTLLFAVAGPILLSLLLTSPSLVAADDSVVFDKACTISSWYIHVSQHQLAADGAGDGILQVAKLPLDGAVRGGFVYLNGRFIF